jgi:L-fucose isomerase-like protein
MDNGLTLGLIFGNRSFFPDALVEKGREEVLAVLDKQGIGSVCPSPKETKLGAVETRKDAKECARLFREQRDKIDGILVSLPNFGDEKGVAETIRMADLNVPVLIHAFPDQVNRMGIGQRRDAFCGKLSVCNNLRQYGIPFSLTREHVQSPDSESFTRDLTFFKQICKIVRGVKGARIGAIGARTNPFNTVRYSEKILESAGISVETIDLSEIFGRINQMGDGEQRVAKELGEIIRYCSVERVPKEALIKMAKFRSVINGWVAENDLDGTAVQCWTSLQEYLGFIPCTMMSMMSESLLPSACEVDVMGALAMYALQLACGSPSAIVDWNNNYGDNLDKAFIFHCSNLPRSWFKEVSMSYNKIIAMGVGQENAWGTCEGPLKPGPITYLRLSTDDAKGGITSYLGEGEIVEDSTQTFGGWGVIEIKNLQNLLRYISKTGFEHHVSICRGWVARSIQEALETYLGWDVYRHD